MRTYGIVDKRSLTVKSGITHGVCSTVTRPLAVVVFMVLVVGREIRKDEKTGMNLSQATLLEWDRGEGDGGERARCSLARRRFYGEMRASARFAANVCQAPRTKFPIRARLKPAPTCPAPSRALLSPLYVKAQQAFYLLQLCNSVTHDTLSAILMSCLGITKHRTHQLGHRPEWIGRGRCLGCSGTTALESEKSSI